jgi:hypothetical protein
MAASAPAASDRGVSATLVALGLLSVWSALTAAQGAAPPVETAEQAPPTPIEQALMEHVCSVVPVGGGPESDRYLACMRTQLLSLRTDFGRDLSRLSTPDRKAVDAACNRVRTTSGREAYLDCLGNQLAVLRSKRSRGNAPPVPVVPVSAEEVAASAAPAVPASQHAPDSGSSGLLIGGGVLVALVAGGGGFLFLKTKRASHKCRVCGAHMESSGDLCQKCRHEAAEAVRRVVADRAEQQRAQEEARKRKKEQAEREEEERLKRAQEEAKQEEGARLRHQQERERDKARTREAEERRRQEEEARELRLAGAASGGEFDPHEVLEVPHGASEDEVRAAYEVARQKSDPSQVSHLSDEVREHFRMKSKAVDRAFQMLVK